MTTAPTPPALAIADLLEYLDGGGLQFDGQPLPEAAAAELIRLQAELECLRTQLEARKPLPLSIERLDELWASQRSFHGGEPLKMGHVEFARLIEVEYGVLGRIPIREENGGQIDHNRISGGTS